MKKRPIVHSRAFDLPKMIDAVGAGNVIQGPKYPCNVGDTIEVKAPAGAVIRIRVTHLLDPREPGWPMIQGRLVRAEDEIVLERLGCPRDPKGFDATVSSFLVDSFVRKVT